MKRSITILQCFLGFYVFTQTVCAQPQASSNTVGSKQVKEWVAQLRDSNYAQRNSAVLALSNHPDDALPLLEQELKSEANSNHRWWLKVAIRECEEKQAKPGEISAAPNQAKGLQTCELCKNGDGFFTVVEREGIHCWHVANKGHYLYFSASDEFRQKAYLKLEIQIEYLDVGTGKISLDYDSTDSQAAFNGAYKNHPQSIYRTNSGQWRKARFELSNARFRGSENNNTDFRFWNGGDAMIIRAVRVWPSRTNN